MLPLLYHAHHSLHPEDLPFWLDLAKQQGGPILELGCGTGRVLESLSEAGYDVQGLDYDRSMLLFLRSRLPAAQVFQADMGHFRLEKRFALILLPCNTYSTLPAETRRLTLERVSEHLLPGDLFAASLPSLSSLMDLPAHGEPVVEEIFLHPESGNPVQASSSWKRSTRSFSMSWHYDHLLPDGTVERVSMQVRHSLLSAGEYIGEFRAAGLKVRWIYGDFDRSEFTRESLSLILIAGKD